MLRPYFRLDRKLLGRLSQCAYQSLKEFFRKTLNREKGVPGAVISIQTFGDLVNFHPHLHCLVTDGCFMPNGWFHVLPEIEVKKLENLRFDQLTPPSKTQFISSLIESWQFKTEQTQAQNGSEPYKN